MSVEIITNTKDSRKTSVVDQYFYFDPSSYIGFKCKRHVTHEVNVGGVKIGGGNPVVIQSMTSGIRTDQNDVHKIAEDEAKEAIELAEHSELVRIALNHDKAAMAVPYIREKMDKAGYKHVPLVGCGQYEIGRLLRDYPDCARSLAKIRINPGNIDFGRKRDKNFESAVEFVRDNTYSYNGIEYPMTLRIGVNWGSLDKELRNQFMDANAQLSEPQPSEEVLRKALVCSVINSAKRAEEMGLPADRIVVSCKVSKVQDLIAVYTELARVSKYALHLGLTEAGFGLKSIVSTTSALSYLLLRGIGDTIRASLTTLPGEKRSAEALLCEQVLQSIGARSFSPQITSCPGCGRTKGDRYQKLAQSLGNYVDQMKTDWKVKYPGVEKLEFAVMGCTVNGPGESKHADIGISLPGYGEKDIAAVFIDGKMSCTLRGDNLLEDSKKIIDDYIQSRYG